MPALRADAAQVTVARQAGGGDLDYPMEQARPAPSGLGWRQPSGGDDRRRYPRLDRRGLPAHPARAILLPAIVPRGEVALIWDVDQHVSKELQRVGGLSARRRAAEPSGLSDRSVTAVAVRSWSRCSSATGFHAP